MKNPWKRRMSLNKLEIFFAFFLNSFGQKADETCKIKKKFRVDIRHSFRTFSSTILKKKSVFSTVHYFSSYDVIIILISTIIYRYNHSHLTC